LLVWVTGGLKASLYVPQLLATLPVVSWLPFSRRTVILVVGIMILAMILMTGCPFSEVFPGYAQTWFLASENGHEFALKPGCGEWWFFVEILCFGCLVPFMRKESKKSTASRRRQAVT
jgi:hypothetical protein